MKGKLRDLFVRPEMRAFVEEAHRTDDYSFFDLLHGYVYGRWIYTYIGIGVGEHPLMRLFSPLARLWKRLFTSRAAAEVQKAAPARDGQKVTFADTYHGKVVSLEAAKQLVTVNQEIHLPDLEKVIPYARARDIVLKNPDHIAVLDCPCRMSREHPCLPMDVCLIVGEPFASFVTAQQPEHARWITPEEAVQILQEEDARGHVHHAFFKDAMLGRFYAICNCCPCCCGAMQAQRNGTPMLASSGYVCDVDSESCVGCGLCADVCPFGALAVDEESGTAVVDAAACMGCGVCVGRCAQGALSLVRDAAKGEPLEIQQLMAAVGEGS